MYVYKVAEHDYAIVTIRFSVIIIGVFLLLSTIILGGSALIWKSVKKISATRPNLRYVCQINKLDNYITNSIFATTAIIKYQTF